MTAATPKRKPKIRKAVPHNVGRPTKYKPEMCQSVVEWGKEGLTFTAIAAELNITRDTLYYWRDSHKPFADALQMAREAAQAYWERLLIKQATGAVQGSTTAAIWSMKNQFPDEYKDRREIDVNAELKVVTVDFLGYDDSIDAEYEEIEHDESN